MKKILCFAIIIALLCFVGCAIPDPALIDFDEQRYVTGVWISYAEIDEMLQGDFKTKFTAAIDNCVSREISDVFVHAVPFCDAYYDSDIYPKRASAEHLNFDVLKYMVDTCHEKGVKFHAWINPYRVRTSDNNVKLLSENSPVKKWLSDDVENDTNVSTVGGVYLNPASSDVRALIIEGVREIIDKYNVDGIHFDDYFYPTQDEEFDAQSYEEYCAKTKNPLSLADFRRASVNALISGVYTAVKFKDKKIAFSISPTASVEENYNRHYADVTAWIQNNCVDYIIPQLYFGFDYPDQNFRFDKLFDEWKLLTKDHEVRLVIGLAAYKIGAETDPDREEWANGKEVIEQQIEKCKNDADISGYIFFSYSAMNEHL